MKFRALARRCDEMKPCQSSNQKRKGAAVFGRRPAENGRRPRSFITPLRIAAVRFFRLESPAAPSPALRPLSKETAPGGGRTHNLRLRRPTLYPVELRALNVEKTSHRLTRRPAAVQMSDASGQTSECRGTRDNLVRFPKFREAPSPRELALSLRLFWRGQPQRLLFRGKIRVNLRNPRSKSPSNHLISCCP